jgi:hypothetical protein
MKPSLIYMTIITYLPGGINRIIVDRISIYTSFSIPSSYEFLRFGLHKPAIELYQFTLLAKCGYWVYNWV